MKVVVYSANFGSKDRIQRAPFGEGCEFHYFTDQPIPHTTWRSRQPQKVFDSPRKMARWHKVNSHLLFPDADVTIWIDGNITLKARLASFLDCSIGKELSSFSHPERSCLYEEGGAVMHPRFESWDNIHEQLQTYRSEGYPPCNGLLETKVVIRQNTPVTRKLNELWWSQIETFSLRDQVSLPYVLWKLNIQPGIIPHSFAKTHKHLIPNA